MRYNIRIKNILPLLAGIFLWHSSPALMASSPETSYELDEVYVFGEAIETAKNDESSINKTVIHVKDKINAGQIQSVGELLKDIAGITVQSTSGGARVAMRGMSDDRFAVAINGNLLSKLATPSVQAYRYNLEWDTIPVDAVQKIEVIRGASSAEYFGTWGGVINIVTLPAPEENKTTVKTSHGSFNTHKYGLFHQESSENGRLSWTLGANKRNSDGYNLNTWQDTEDFNASLQYQLKEKELLSFSFGTNHKKQGIENAIGKFDEWRTHDYALKYATSSSEISIFQNDRTYTTNQMMNRTTSRFMTNQGFSWKQTLQKKHHTLTYGLQEQYYDFDFSPADMKNVLHGLYIQDKWKLNSELTLGLGARYDVYHVDLDSTLNPLFGKKGNPSTASYSQLSPKVSLTKHIQPNEEIFASASSVFRPANIGEYFYWGNLYYDPWSSNSAAKKLASICGISTQTEWQEKNGALQPEKGWSYELGWRKQATPRLSWQLTGFYNSIDNYIYQSYPAAIRSGYTSSLFVRNIPHVTIKGAEAALNYAFSQRLTGNLSLTTQNASKAPDFFDPGTALESLPKNTVHGGLSYQSGPFRTSIDVYYLSRRNNLGGAATTDLSLLYEKKNATVALSIGNIFNKHTQDETGSFLPGTNYSLSLQYKL